MKNILFLFLLVSSVAQAQIDRKEIYKALASESKETLVTQLSKLEKLDASKEKDAFIGAVKMKLSGFQKTAKEKLNMFNDGKAKLESAISKDNTNTEFRFLRLLIQENAPKQLKYNGDLKTDAAMVIAGYSDLKEATKQAISSYAKKSSYLLGL